MGSEFPGGHRNPPGARILQPATGHSRGISQSVARAQSTVYPGCLVGQRHSGCSHSSTSHTRPPGTSTTPNSPLSLTRAQQGVSREVARHYWTRQTALLRSIYLSADCQSLLSRESADLPASSVSPSERTGVLSLRRQQQRSQSRQSRGGS